MKASAPTKRDRARSRHVLVVVLLFVCTVSMHGLSPFARAQEAEPAPSTPVVEVEQGTSAPQSIPAESAPGPAPDVVSVEATEAAEIPVQKESNNVETDREPEVLVADPVQASLTYWPDSSPACSPADPARSESIVAGSFIDYRCTYSISAFGDGVTVDDLSISMTIMVDAPEGYSVRYRSNPLDDLAWSDPQWFSTVLNEGEIHAEAIETRVVSDPGSSSLGFTMTLTIHVRLERGWCSKGPGVFEVSGDGDVRVTTTNDVQVSRVEPSEAQTFLTPEVVELPNDTPAILVTGMQIVPVQFSLTDQTTTGVVTVSIENATVTCRWFDIHVAVTNQSNALQSGPTRLVAASGGPTSLVVANLDVDSSLEEPISVAHLPAGTLPGSHSLAVSFEVPVPGGLATGAFSVNATVAIEPVSP